MAEIIRESSADETIVNTTTRKLQIIETNPVTWPTGEDRPNLGYRLVEDIDWVDTDGRNRHKRLEHVTEFTEDNLVFFKIMWELALKSPRIPENTDVCVIGGGLSVLQRIMCLSNWKKFDVYELEQGLKDWNDDNLPDVMAKTNWIIGDYKDKLLIKYDVIIFEVDEIPRVDLSQHLKRGGVVYYYNEADIHKPLSTNPYLTT